MSEISLKASKREISSKGANNKLRRTGFVPGVLYSKGTEPAHISVFEGDLKKLVYTSETHIVNLQIEGQEGIQSILKTVQFDPVTDKVIHFDLLGITVGQELELEVPVSVVGQAKGVRDGGVLQQSLHKLHVACLPKNIPEHITIDISNLSVGEAIHIKDLNYEGVRFLHQPDAIIAAVAIPRATAEAATAEGAEGAAEPEVIGKGKSEEEE